MVPAVITLFKVVSIYTYLWEQGQEAMTVNENNVRRPPSIEITFYVPTSETDPTNF